MRLVTVFKYKTFELSHVCYLHCIEVNTGNKPTKKITAAVTREKYHTAVHHDWLLSSHVNISQSLNSSRLLTASALPVRCLSCMTCYSPRSIFGPDLRPRRRHSTASPLSFVRPSSNCSPVGAQRIVQPVFYMDTRMISTSMDDRLSCSVDGRPTADR